MKLFGSLRELVAAVFRKDTYDVTLKPNAGSYTGAVEIQLPPKLIGNDVLVGQDVAQTLTNKTLNSTSVVDGSKLSNAQVRKSTDGTGTSQLRFYNDAGTAYTSVEAGAGLGTTYSLKLPNTLPASVDSVLANDGTGTSTWKRVTDSSVASAVVSRDASGNFSAGTITATLSGNATTATTAGNVSGVVAIANGGTGQSTQQAAINALVGTQTANRVLRSDGTNMSLSQVALGTDVSGTLPIANGGTGQTTASGAINALVPAQTGNNGKVLSTDGSAVSWASALTDPTTTTGDIIYRDGSGVLTRLGVGASGTVLKGGTTPSYSAIVDADVSASAAIAGSKIQAANGATNAGVVSTVAQDFGGLKTFLGGASIKGNSGSSVAAGYIGEYKSATCTTNTTVNAAADTYVDVTGMSFTLEAGVWLVSYQVSVGFTWAAGGLNANASIALTTAANAIESFFVGFLAQRMESATNNISQSVSRSGVLVVPSTTTYKIRGRASLLSTSTAVQVYANNVTGGLTDPDNASTMWAVRIA